MGKNASVTVAIVYDKNSEMNSFVPLPGNQRLEIDAAEEKLSQSSRTLPWPPIGSIPLSEFHYLAALAFPTLFPDAKGDPTNPGLERDILFFDKIKHPIKFAEKQNGKWIYCFANHPRFSYWALNMIQRQRALSTGNFYLKQNPGDGHLTVDDLQQMDNQRQSSQFLSKVSRYAANITGTAAYWQKVRDEPKAIIAQKSTNILFHFLISRYALT